MNYIDYYTRYDVNTFFSIIDLQKRIPKALAYIDLLNAAVFWFTNIERQKYGLRQFQFHDKLMQMATLHSEQMRLHSFFDHENSFDIRFKTLTDRLNSVKDDNFDGFMSFAENIADCPVIKANESFTYTKLFGKTHLYSLDGKEIFPFTYTEMAKSVVDAWMNSPGHRANILNPEYKYLGCGCAPYESQSTGYSITYFKLTQNFGGELMPLSIIETAKQTIRTVFNPRGADNSSKKKSNASFGGWGQRKNRSDMAELSIGTQIRLKNGKTCKVKKELGRGGQGIVYVVDYGGKDYALKWYTSSTIINSEAFYKNLNNNVNTGSPAPNFIWPLAITERQSSSFGYVMELRPKGFVDMSEFLLLHAQFDSVNAQLNACLQISMAFRQLHIRGLSYQDMNDGNFFVNPKTGDVLICDNDNVAPDGVNISGIAGKAGYMAPEIVEGRSMPNKYTDYYSLAVCLFLLIYMNRPFEGKWYLSCPCDNQPEMAKKLLGFSSVFIMDPNDPKNRPVPGVHNNVIKRWAIYPSLLATAFCKTFSKEAIQDQTKRLMDRQWHNILLQVRSMFVKCPNCGNSVFLDTQQPNKPCAWCNKPFNTFKALKVGRFTIPLVAGQTIYDCQVTGQTNYELKAGEVISKNNQLGFHNTSSYPWTVTLPDNSVKVVNNGCGMPIRAGLRIKFGNQGEIAEIV